ncbi:oxygen-independent coproporphyrinogen III oxidase [Ponticaulis sp.]|uniref:oxygen-independent coproporphyrinogen III oxidase n=1 Tax=Ponticaulis sp. TaxID=2020902 RepID=UPI000B6EA989|nr:oxygen-independent coproporphyrinogen III oxidase [Ponticaulis sp.]MAI91658.1 oxygen-independent coproporphyrinogen III oxidase [Ponticaulis sp.]OUX97223.1 MAG: oxygen-independent coproporphyrinogen III oxidase [Hyphomonadaceae bacterium TMED5]
MREDWFGLAQKPVPRYTSYPTAAQFQDAPDRDAVSSWIEGIGADEPISVYVHVPFCEQLCWYCGCHTTVPNGYARIGRYVDVLLKEMELWKAKLPKHGGGVHLHFGGGTPNALNPDDMLRVLEALREAFCITDDAEISIELDPRTLNPEMIQAMAAGGVTRASLGVQDFNRTVQEAINRVQPFLLVKGAVEALRAADIKAINFDLLYGLPHQTAESVEHSAELAASLMPDRISAFGYAHVPWFAKHQRAIDEKHLPNTQARFDQYEAIADVLGDYGYTQIGLDHFARDEDDLAQALSKGTLHRNFQGYTTDTCRTLIALGPSGISEFPGGFAQNAKDIREYTESINAGELALRRGVARTFEDRLHGAVIERLMCDMSVDVAKICRDFDMPVSHFDEAFARLKALEEKGICRLTGSHVSVPLEARALLRTVAQCFDAYSAPDAVPANRHAKAV